MKLNPAAAAAITDWLEAADAVTEVFAEIMVAAHLLARDPEIPNALKGPIGRLGEACTKTVVACEIARITAGRARRHLAN